MKYYGVMLEGREVARTPSPLYALGRAGRERDEHPRMTVRICDVDEPERGDVTAELQTAVSQARMA